MTILSASVTLLATAALLLWIMSGASIFVWISRAALHAEAVRLQVISSIAVAVRDFRSGYSGTLAVIKAMENER